MVTFLRRRIALGLAVLISLSIAHISQADSVPISFNVNLEASASVATDLNLDLGYPTDYDKDYASSVGVNSVSVHATAVSLKPPAPYDGNPEQWDWAVCDASLSCQDSDGSSPAVISSSVTGVYYSWKSKVRNRPGELGEMTIGTSESCPAGTPLMLWVSPVSFLVNMNTTFDFTLLRGEEEVLSLDIDNLYDAYDSIIQTGSGEKFSIPVEAGETLNFAYFYENSSIDHINAFFETITNTVDLDFEAVAVPEPSSVALLLFGFAGLAVCRWKGRNRQG